MRGMDPARYAKEQGKCVIGYRFIQQAGRVGDHDTQLGGGGDIDALESHAPTGNDLEFRGFVAGQYLGGKIIHTGINTLHAGHQKLHGCGRMSLKCFWQTNFAAGFEEHFSRSLSHPFNCGRGCQHGPVRCHGLENTAFEPRTPSSTRFDENNI